MPTLYVTEPGSTVRFSGGSLHVTVEREVSSGARSSAQTLLLNVEPHRLELIGLVGRVHKWLEILMKNGSLYTWLPQSLPRLKGD